MIMLSRVIALAVLPLAVLIVANPRIVRAEYNIPEPCRGIVSDGSRLLHDIVNLKGKISCKIQRDSNGHDARVYRIEGALDPATATFSLHDFPDRLFMTIVRYEEAIPIGELPEVGAFGHSSKVAVKILKSVENATPGNGPAIAHVIRLDEADTSIASACIVADFIKESGLPTRVAVCRSADRNSSDADIFAKAGEIATTDLPNITP